MKSPIKGKALRSPGESLSKKINEYIENHLLHYFIASSVFTTLAIVEWCRWYLNAKPNPIFYSIVAICVILISTWKITQSLKKIRRLKQGLEGERAVGQFLDELRNPSLKVLHDISAENFNVDHLIICTSGIFVIETKTLLKPEMGEPKLIFDGDQVIKNGYPLERNPVSQTKAASQWIQGILKESTGRHYSTKPVVVFPGWYIEALPNAKKSDVWVLNPKALPTYIQNSKPILSLEDVNLCYFHLKCYVRNLIKP